MKIEYWIAKNIQKIEEAKFDVKGKWIYLLGGHNGEGKTSGIVGLLMAVAGKSAMENYPEIALKDGEDEGEIIVKIDDPDSPHEIDRIVLKLKRKRTGTVMESFAVYNRDGDEAPTPRAILQSLFQFKGFDPLEFERMKPKEQAKVLRELSGVDFTDLDRKRAEAYSERTVVNKEVKRLTTLLSTVPKHTDVPKEPLSSTELLEILDARTAHNEAIKKAQVRHDELVVAEKKIASDVDAMKKQLAKLQADLAEAEGQHKVVQGQVAEAADVVKMMTPEDVDEVRTQMAEIDATNKKIMENKAYEEKKAEVKATETRANRLSAKIEQIDKQKSEMIEKADWPVEGLEFDEDSVIYQGLPFMQINAAERSVVSAQIGMALNPTLRLLVVMDGSRLDLDTLKRLEELCIEKDFLMIIEFVTRTDADERLCSAVIEDGRLKDVVRDSDGDSDGDGRLF